MAVSLPASAPILHKLRCINGDGVEGYLYLTKPLVVFTNMEKLLQPPGSPLLPTPYVGTALQLSGVRYM